MLPRPLDDRTLREIQKLIEGNFTGRDELYAAADSLDDDARKHICRRLAKHLADNATELQQILAASGVEPAGPLDMESLADRLFDLAKANRGESGVLRSAAEGERNLKADYDKAIDATPDPEAKAVFDRQREEVEFGEQVLRNIDERDPSKE